MPDPAIDATKQVKVKRPPGRPYKDSINESIKHADTVKKLFQQGLSQREIAKLTDLGQATISRLIHKTFTNTEIEAFRLTEAERLDGIRMEYLSLVDTDALKKMIDRRGMVDYGVIWDKANMIRTGNDGTSKPMVLIQIAGQGVTIGQPTDTTTQHDSMTHETDSETAGAVTDRVGVGSAAKPAI